MQTQTVEEIHAAARREQILRAAQAVFAEKGYHRATTKAIARAAGLAEGTIFLYFKTKSDLLMALFDTFVQMEQRPQLHVESLPLSLEAFYQQHLIDKGTRLAPYFSLLQAVMPEILADPDLRRRYIETILQPGLRELEAFLSLRAANGEFSVDQIPYLTRLLTGAMLGLEILFILEDPFTREMWNHPEDHAAAFVKLLFAGLRPDSGAADDAAQVNAPTSSNAAPHEG